MQSAPVVPTPASQGRGAITQSPWPSLGRMCTPYPARLEVGICLCVYPSLCQEDSLVQVKLDSPLRPPLLGPLFHSFTHSHIQAGLPARTHPPWGPSTSSSPPWLPRPPTGAPFPAVAPASLLPLPQLPSPHSTCIFLAFSGALVVALTTGRGLPLSG